MSEIKTLYDYLDHNSISIVASKLETSTDKYNLAKYLNDREMKNDVVNDHQIEFILEDTTEYTKKLNLNKTKKVDNFNILIKDNMLYINDDVIQTYKTQHNIYLLMNECELYINYLVVFQPRKIDIIKLDLSKKIEIITTKFNSFIKTVDQKMMLITLEDGKIFTISPTDQDDMILSEMSYQNEDYKLFTKNKKITRIIDFDSMFGNYLIHTDHCIAPYKVINKYYDEKREKYDILFEMYNILSKAGNFASYVSTSTNDVNGYDCLMILEAEDLIKFTELLFKYMK